MVHKEQAVQKGKVEKQQKAIDKAETQFASIWKDICTRCTRSRTFLQRALQVSRARKMAGQVRSQKVAWLGAKKRPNMPLSFLLLRARCVRRPASAL